MLVEQLQKLPEMRDLVTVMLTSGGQRGDGQRCKELGIAAYLIKPVLQSDLLEALMRVLGPRSDPTEAMQLITRHTLREARLPLTRFAGRRQHRKPAFGGAVARKRGP